MVVPASSGLPVGSSRGSCPVWPRSRDTSTPDPAAFFLPNAWRPEERVRDGQNPGQFVSTEAGCSSPLMAQRYNCFVARVLGSEQPIWTPLCRLTMVAVLAFAGRMGSGKTTLTTALARAFGCKRASFGDYVRHVVKARGFEQTRENLQKIGTELLEQDRLRFCSDVLHHAGWTPGEALVIDGLRHAETISLIRQLVSPLGLRIIFLEIDDDIRLERLEARGDGEREALSLAEAHSSEQQVISVLARQADLIIDSGDSVQESVRRVVEWARCQ